MLARSLCVLALLATAPAAASADWYRWRDASGTVHVTNQLADLPPAEAERFLRAPPPPAPAPPVAAPAAAGAVDERATVAADLRRRRASRLADTLAHLALLRATGRSDAATLALENQLEDAARLDREALR